MLATWGCSTFPKPTLSLDFAGATSLDSGITFSRGSQATLFDSTGTLVYAKHNLALQSQDFATTWTTARINVSSDAIVAPNGTITADKLIATSVAGSHTIFQSVSVTPQAYTFSLYAKKGEYDFVQLNIPDPGAGGAGKVGSFNIATGTLGAVQDAGVTRTITAVGDGWYRCTVTFTPTGAGSSAIGIFVTQTDVRAQSFTGDNVSGIFTWGAQLNLANMEGGVTSSLTTYYPTTTAAYYAPRFDYNPSTLQPRGLLIEEQRTNLEPNSEALTSVLGASILNNVTTAPSGLVTADKVVEDTSTGAHQVATTSVTWVGNTAYTFTIFLKADTRTQVQIAFGTSTNWVAGQRNAQFDVLNGTVLGTAGANVTASIEAVGNGWYRCRMTCTTVAVPVGPSTIQIQMYVGGTASYTGNGTSGLFFWGAQIEAGSFPTSYIPTSGTTLTRNADVASMTGTNFSSWYNATQGTLFAQFLRTATVNSQQGRVFSLSNASNTALIELYQTSGTDPAAQIIDTTTQGQWTTSGYTVGVPVRQALAYQLNNSNAAYNGTAQTPDTVCTIPTVTQANIGNRQDGVRNLNGWIQRLSYYPTRLPDSTLQALTA